MLLDVPTWAACMGWLEHRGVGGLLGLDGIGCALEADMGK